MVERRPDRTLGPGHDDFWAWCDAGEFRLPECTRCGSLTWPVAASCETCGGSGFEWKRLSGRGTLISWCTFVQDYYRGAIAVPYTTILVSLEEGPVFLSNFADEGSVEPKLDMPLSVAFRPCEDSAGRFNLPVFAPA